MTTEARNNGAESPHLRRELHLWEAVGISLALMAPSMAANINPQGTAGSVGRAARVRAGDHRCAFDRLDLRLACVVGATRLLYALSRDEVGPAPLGTVSPRSGVPARSTATVAVGAYVIIALGWFVFGVAPFDLFVASGTIGTLILLLVYALATIGAAKLLFFSGERQVATWEVIVPSWRSSSSVTRSIATCQRGGTR